MCSPQCSLGWGRNDTVFFFLSFAHSPHPLISSCLFADYETYESVTAVTALEGSFALQHFQGHTIRCFMCRSKYWWVYIIRGIYFCRLRTVLHFFRDTSTQCSRELGAAGLLVGGNFRARSRWSRVFSHSTSHEKILIVFQQDTGTRLGTRFRRRPFCRVKQGNRSCLHAG